MSALSDRLAERNRQKAEEHGAARPPKASVAFADRMAGVLIQGVKRDSKQTAAGVPAVEQTSSIAANARRPGKPESVVNNDLQIDWDLLTKGDPDLSINWDAITDNRLRETPSDPAAEP